MHNTITRITNIKHPLYYIAAVLIMAFLYGILSPKSVLALDGSQFNPGRIIDDSIFYNSGAMNAEQIQNFLNAKLPTCDTNGSQSIGYYFNAATGEVNKWNNVDDGDVWVTTTRAIYGDRVASYGGEWRGSRAPITCMKDYRQTTENIAPESGLCNGYTGAANESISQILYKISVSCGINPQVLLVLLQKEQSLITDDWPWGIQYMKATGVSCPDSYPAEWAPYNCDPAYLGFFKQMYYGAHRFKRYKANADNYNYKAARNNTILWNPNAGCGTSNVFIANQATAALYIYTPYRPNNAALFPNSGPTGLYGTGDACSSYGNRNFWRMFNDWFGATIAVDLPGCVEATNTTRSCVWMLRNPNGQSYFTAQVNARDALVAGSGYSYVWSPFFGNAVSLPGNIPIYRLTKPNGGSLITASKPEYDYLAANGFDGQGIDFYADPANSNSGYTVYRLYKPSTDEHIWVKGESDRSVAINNWGFTDEGVAFNSISPIRQEQAAPTNQLLVYRFADMPGNSHFWTTDLAERDRMINQGYNYERVAWNSSALTTTKKVYRLYSSKMQKHLYTLDENEKNILSASGFWVYEGISQYMSDAPTARPVYRLYSPVTTNHLWTTDANERDVLVRSGTFRDEGIAWYQP